MQEKHTESYRLILVGHSLGAGTAAILAMLLRPTYPDLFCYAFSPPGATLRYMLYFVLFLWITFHKSIDCVEFLLRVPPPRKTLFQIGEKSGNVN